MTPWSERRDAPADTDGIVRLVRIAAYAVCRDGERILCCRLAPGEPSPGSWTLPGGGIDFGERPEAAVLRELEEETGLVGRVDGIAAVRSRVFPGKLRDGRPREMQALALLYRVTVVGGTLRDEPAGSTDRAAWLTRGELATERIVAMMRTALEIAFGGEGRPPGG
ncbi:MAG: NUDIX domain-containing protein [Chloroflexota bacterium]